MSGTKMNWYPSTSHGRSAIKALEDDKFMRAALLQAKLAARKDEVPVGAVIVQDGIIIARAHNLRESSKDPSAHAELLAIRKAAKKLGGWRLTGCTLYVTLEPCPMCCGAAINARLTRIVYGAPDAKAGCCDTLYQLCSDDRFNHQVNITGGVLAEQCGSVLSEFFKNKRKK